MKLNDGVVNNNDYIKVLNLFSEYDFKESIEDFAFEYVIDDERLTKLKDEFKYNDFIDEDHQFQSMVKLMVWVFHSLRGDGMCVPPSKFNAEIVLKRTKNEGLLSNCYMYATVLNEIFLSMGFFSRMVRCMPVDLNYGDCHCVTEVYSDDYNKWVIFDAANKAYYVDRHMIPLNLFELREAVRAQKTIYVPGMGRAQTTGLMQYWAKNLVRFESYQISRYGNESELRDSTMLHFQSKNFPVSDKTVYYKDFDIRIHHIHTSNPQLFWKRPYERCEKVVGRAEP